MPAVGDAVVYHDTLGNAHNALVTAVWGTMCINLVCVSDNVNAGDQYGRQIERYPSTSHKSVMPTHGNYWRWAEEEPNPVVAPTSV